VALKLCWKKPMTETFKVAPNVVMTPRCAGRRKLVWHTVHRVHLAACCEPGRCFCWPRHRCCCPVLAVSKARRRGEAERQAR